VRTKLVLPAALVAATLALGGCADSSGDASGTTSGPSSSSSTKGGTTVDITIKAGKVTPNGDRVKASVGAPITLRIDADTAGEIHVHSSPEQHIEFPKGTSTRKLTIDQPGIVDVEDHALEQVIVQLQVS
jgi:hypothetical protein